MKPSKMPSTLFQKLWDSHTVHSIPGGPDALYIDLHLIHEVTSPVAFLNLQKRNLKVFRPENTLATVDHIVPTANQHLRIKNELARKMVDTLRENCRRHAITFYDLGHDYQGIVHVIGPELGITRPGYSIVCGDSHTSTHGALGTLAFGIGTSEIEMVLATQCILQNKPQAMRIQVNGELRPGILAKDVILHILSKISASGGTGHFIEYTGQVIQNLSMEGRMTVCNMSIESGARGGLIAPDQVTYNYIKGKEFAPQGQEFQMAVDKWEALKSDKDATFDKQLTLEGKDIPHMITFGTNPGMGMSIKDKIPSIADVAPSERPSFKKSLEYMGLKQNETLNETPIDYIFVGSCTNGRIEDLRVFSHFVKGRQKAPSVTAWIVPGSKQVAEKAREEGIVEILSEAGFEMRQPGCSACLAMNDDRIPEGKYALSTTNRNFEGRQGPRARTILAGPLVAAASAVTGKITDPTTLVDH